MPIQKLFGGKQNIFNVSVRLKEKGGHGGIRNMKSKGDEYPISKR